MDDHVRYDLAFHTAIRACCGNDRIIHHLGCLQDQTTLVMRSSASAPGAMGDKVRTDHRAILDAVLAGDPDGAERAARAHVRAIARFVDRNQTPAPRREPAMAGNEA